MPLLKCSSCHHEWEGSRDSTCDWCNHGSYVLKDKTELEEFLDGKAYEIIAAKAKTQSFDEIMAELHAESDIKFTDTELYQFIVKYFGTALLYLSWFIVGCVVLMLVL